MNTSVGKFWGMAAMMATLISGWANASSITLQDFLTVDETNAGSAIFMDFCVVEPSNSSDSDLAALDFMLAITTNDALDTVFFEFVNRSPIASTITEIYFDDGAPLDTDGDPAPFMGNGWVSAFQGNVYFEVGKVKPKDLPGGNNLDPVFNANEDLSAEEEGNGNAPGVDPGENVVLAYEIFDLAALAAAVDNGTLRVGFHTRAIGTAGDSDAFVNCTTLDGPPPAFPPDTSPPVPEPSTMILLGMGSAFLAMRKRRSA